MTSKAEIRSQVVSEIEKLLIGPRQGENEFIAGRITLAYLSGMLFPKGEKRSDLSRESIESFEDDVDGHPLEQGKSQEFSGDYENPLSMANEELPSSVGISFVVHNTSKFEVLVDAAHYEACKNEAGQKGFRRKSIPKEAISSTDLSSKQHTVLDGAANLSVIERPSSFRNDCKIVTVSLVNAATAKGSQHRAENLANRLYQVSLECRCESPGIEPYDAFFERSSNIEENILQLQYRQNPTYAVGHGCSVDWMSPGLPDETVKSVRISYMPRQSVYRPLFDRLVIGEGRTFDGPNVFNIRRLATASDQDQPEICAELLRVVEFYEDWIEFQNRKDCLGYEEAAESLLTRMKLCAQRMRSGVKLLEEDPQCWKAFTLANLAMLLQIEQTGRIRKIRSEREKDGSPWPIPWEEKVHTFSTDIESLPGEFSPSWRPFQLAFFLTSVSGLENPEGSDHSIVDLIWFSTGGGKTEAYLLLSSYELIRRRMRYDNFELGGGTAVITRYTLRFLTADQFSRTASLGCALEKVRHTNAELLGDEPFRIGLYIGSTQSFAKYSDAQTALQELMSAPNGQHHFQISECPNCGTSLVPNELVYDDEGRPKGFGIRSGVGLRIEYVCPNTNCMFSSDLKIPVTVIDEEIFDHPPSFLLGTIDKFAMVPWRERSGRIFGRRGNGAFVVPPTLVIQDELHLISGPLGTIAAIYEAGFDSLIKTYQSKLGMPQTGPKYVASSATVRDSEKQIERLTGRTSAIFPPRGISADDACFSREEKLDDTARLYLGVMGQGIRATSAAHWTSAALLQSVRYVSQSLGSRENCDFLWTLLCYCNSKRELGLINGAVSQEIFERMRVYAEAQGLDPENLESLVKEEVSADGVKSISETRGNLLIGVSDTGRSVVKDFVPCTNMISVGIDIDRLGVMLVNGQPKTTSEYIQATSRVGRSPNDKGPGLVITLYSPAKPRDRSHYEHFKNYHETLYRLVEPTSVTPGSEQALAKACHAAVTTVVRHGVDGMAQNGSAARLDLNDMPTREVVHAFKERLLLAYQISDVFERGRISEAIDSFLGNWASWTQHNLHYALWGRTDFSLLTKHNSSNSTNVGVPTMMSMRGVDVEVEVRK